MENNNELIVVKQLPVIEDQLRSIKSQFEERTQYALSLEVSEETVKDVKKVRAELTKIFNELESRRKAIKAEILKPLNDFMITYEDCVIKVYAPAKAKLDQKINEVEDKLKEERAVEIKEYFDEYIISKNIDFLSFEQLGLNITLLVSKRKLKEQVKEFIDRVSDDLQMIETQEHKEEIIVEYKKTLNVSQAIISVNNRHTAIEAEKKKAEELAKIRQQKEDAQSKVEAVIEEKREFEPPVEIPDETQIDQEENTVSEKIYKASFTIKSTLPKIKAVKHFLEIEGIDYECN